MAAKKVKLSVVLATYNEEANIGRCLKAVKNWASEIIIVDGSSTDKTRGIARKLGAKVYKTSNKPIFHINKQLALDKASCKWVLQLDADEVVPPALKAEIQQAIKQEEYDAYFLARRNYFLGKWLRKGGQYPDYVIRLVKKSQAHFPCQSVHEQIAIKGRVGYLQNPLDHFAVPTIGRYWQNANRYTSLTAKELAKKSRISLLAYIIGKPIKTFFIIYVRHKGFLDGFRGFLFALFSALHWPIAFFKYWEIKNKK